MNRGVIAQMSRKKKLLLVAVAAAVVVAGIVGVVAVQAQTTPTATAANKNPIVARVAQILGIDQSKLEAAFKQAEQEQRAQALDNYLKITDISAPATMTSAAKCDT